MPSLVTYEEALAIVLRSGVPGATEVVTLANAQGRVLADSPRATDAIPTVCEQRNGRVRRSCR